MAMKWKKPSQKLIEKFHASVPGPPAEHRKMFGFPAAFVNGNLFMGIFQESVMLRLPDAAPAEMGKLPGVVPFEPMPGRPMKEYVTVPDALISNRAKLAPWIAKSFAYAQSLPAKGKAPKSKRSAPHQIQAQTRL